MRRTDEINYVKAAEFLKGSFSKEIEYTAFKRGLVPEELARRVFVGEYPRNAELLSDEPEMQVRSSKRRNVRVYSTKSRSGVVKMAAHDGSHGRTHQVSAIKAYWNAMTPEQRKTEMARRLQKREEK